MAENAQEMKASATRGLLAPATPLTPPLPLPRNARRKDSPPEGKTGDPAPLNLQSLGFAAAAAAAVDLHE